MDAQTFMSEEDLKYLSCLRNNLGFEDPPQWIETAKRLKFKSVGGSKITCCPSCHSQRSDLFGQYIYYSNLCRLQTCQHCGLIYNDVRLPEGVVQTHFEQGYKDENYFRYSREGIFREIADYVARVAPPNASILDVGGATGHLLATIEERRKDLLLVLNDVSAVACDKARRDHNLNAVCGKITEVREEIEEFDKSGFDMVLLIDVIYYEPNVRELWQTLEMLSAPTSILVLRIPNKLLLVEAFQKLRNRLMSERARQMQCNLPGFNPEHIYAFSRQYMANALGAIGYNRRRYQPSKVLVKKPIYRPLASALDAAFRFLYKLSKRKLVLSPSTYLVARRDS